MIDGNLAVEADEPVACAWATCQWDGCTRGRFRLVSVPGAGKLWLCRLHVDEGRRRGRPAVEVREHDGPRACEWPGGCNGFARATMPILGVGMLRLCRSHAQAVADERSAEARAGRSQRTATPQAAPSPAAKVREHDEARTCRPADGRQGARAAAFAFAWLTCRWPDGCKRGGVRLVGELWLCRRHAGEVPAGAPVALGDTRRRSGAVAEECIAAQAAPSPAAVRPAVEPEPSPSRAPTKADVDGEPRRRAVRPGLSSRMASALWTLARGVAEGVVVACGVAVVLFGMAVLVELAWRLLVAWVL